MKRCVSSHTSASFCKVSRAFYVHYCTCDMGQNSCPGESILTSVCPRVPVMPSTNLCLLCFSCSCHGNQQPARAPAAAAAELSRGLWLLTAQEIRNTGCGQGLPLRRPRAQRQCSSSAKMLLLSTAPPAGWLLSSVPAGGSLLPPLAPPCICPYPKLP